MQFGKVIEIAHETRSVYFVAVKAPILFVIASLFVRHLLARRYSRWPNLERGESFGATGFRYWLADPAADPTSSSRDDHIIACAHNRSAGDRSNGASDPSGCLDQRPFGSRDRALSEEFRSVESSEWVERHAR